MAARWKRSLGVGLGAGLFGAALVAIRRRSRGGLQPSLPDIISPEIFARRVQRTTRGQIVYHSSGEGEPIIFLHDFFPGAASYEWSKVYPFFAANARVLVPDWIGFGESERPDRMLRLEDYAQSLQEFTRATCGGKRPIIVASGLGASIACMAAAQHPEFVSRLILFHPTGTSGWMEKWVSAPWRLAAWTNKGRHWLWSRYLATPEGIGRWLEGRRSKVSDLNFAEAVSVYASFARQYGAAWAVLRILSGRFQAEALPRLSEVCAPVTIWWPAEGTSAPVDVPSENPRVAWHFLEKSGPLAPLDNSLEITKHLQEEIFHPIRIAD